MCVTLSMHVVVLKSVELVSAYMLTVTHSKSLKNPFKCFCLKKNKLCEILSKINSKNLKDLENTQRGKRWFLWTSLYRFITVFLFNNILIAFIHGPTLYILYGDGMLNIISWSGVWNNLLFRFRISTADVLNEFTEEIFFIVNICTTESIVTFNVY